MPLPVVRLRDRVINEARVEVTVARLDQIHPAAPGNKIFKLIPNLVFARERGFGRVASFGGAFSNHIHALAALCREWDMTAVGFVRDTTAGRLTPTLEDALRCGMELHFINRADYRRRREPDFLAGLEREVGHCYWVPEGGSNLAGVRGCALIPDVLKQAGTGDFDELLLPVGTGGTLAGIAAGLDDGARVVGLSVLKGEAFLEKDIARFLAGMEERKPDNWQVDHRFHCGGYARTTPELLAFIREFEDRHGIPLEPVYSGKLFFGLYQRLKAGEYNPGDRIVALHTGGLQGRRGGLSEGV